MGERRRTFALKDHWSGPTVQVGADVRFLQRVVAAILLIWRWAVTIALIVGGRYDLTMFTYWSNTIWLAYLCMHNVSLWSERWPLDFVVLFAFVFPLALTFVVCVSIVIIINENSDVFTAAATSGDLALSLIHTGDWILHSLPLIEILVLIAAGWYLYVRGVLAFELSSLRRSEWKAAYFLYWFLAPLVPLLIYTLIFDPAEKYPTGIPTYVLWLGLFALDLMWMALWYFAFTNSADVVVVTYSLFRSHNKAAGDVPLRTESELVSARLNRPDEGTEIGVIGMHGSIMSSTSRNSLGPNIDPDGPLGYIRL